MYVEHWGRKSKQRKKSAMVVMSFRGKGSEGLETELYLSCFSFVYNKLLR